MKAKHFDLKRNLIIFHILSGVMALLFIILFIQNGKYQWSYISFLLGYILSGTVFLALFFTTLRPLQRLYFELQFLVPLLVMAFWLFLKAFEYFLFGK